MTPPWKTTTFAQLAMPLTKALGADTAKAFLGLNCVTVGDLLHLLPRHLMSGTDLTDLRTIIDHHRGSEEYLAVIANVASVEVKGQSPRQRLEVRLSDGRATLTATFFGRSSLISYWQKILSQSTRGIFAGKLSWFHDAPQLAHPAFVMITDDGFVGSKQNAKMAKIATASSFVGLYPQTSKLPTWTVSESISLVLNMMVGLDDPLPDWIRKRAEVPALGDALRDVHTPTSKQAYGQGVKRLLFDEAFAAQVAMAYRRHGTSTMSAIPRVGGKLLKSFDSSLHFTLTNEQIRVGEEIAEDLAKDSPMQRLLQGEVGSGKTVLALRAMLSVVDSGGQGVLLAPTEVLAHQHYETITTLLGDLGCGSLLSGGVGTNVALLTGSMTPSARSAALEEIWNGQAGIIVGTHALLSRAVKFHDLGLVVVDEQHRFGVEQRHALASQEDSRPHVLVMTATPIPRSVAMTVFADLDMSTLQEIPAGRAEVATTVIDVTTHPTWVDRAWQRVREEVEQGHQVYIVAPRIDPSDGKDGASVVELAEQLSSGVLKNLRVDILHGRMPGSEKTATMQRFAAHELDVLVATSMIEVGLDQPNATMMVIVDADMFGISQLHQLRGRIGRGAYPGVCLLMTKAEEGSQARHRLAAVASTTDGFLLAEKDIEFRKEGDVLGMSQSGKRSSLRLLKVLEHSQIIELARSIAAEVVTKDPQGLDPGIADYIMDIETRAQGDLEDST
ncbi:MAG: ATP-dependent DNA helicase RecG [Propionibacteriaceae bacterium]|nr:ATP-dependent DNA helicase RecG [Propionibacteriaceae bacterium]